MATRIGAVSADFEANTVSFDRNVTKAANTLRTNATRMNKSLAGIESGFNQVRRVAGALGLALGLGTLVSFGRRALDAAGNLQDTADKIGFTTDALQKLRFAAEQSGVAQTALDMGLQRFSRRLGEAAQGQGELIKTAQQYNIAVTDSDGRMRSNIDVLRDFADVIKNADSEQERLRIAFKLFDSEGAALVNTLRDGASGLNAAMQKAVDFGAVIETDLIPQAKDASDKIRAMETSLSTMGRRIAVNVAPAVSALADELARLGKAPSLTERIAEAQRQLEMFQNMPDIVPGKSGIVRRAQERLDALRFSGTGDFGSSSGGGAKPGAAPRTAADDKAAETAAAKIRTVVEQLEAERSAIGKSAVEMEVYNNLKKAGVEANSAAGQRIEALTRSLASEELTFKLSTEAAEAHGDAMIALIDDAARLTAETATPLEQYQKRVERINLLQSKGFIDSETASRALTRAMVDSSPVLKGLEDSARDFGTAIGTAFEDAIIKGESFRDVFVSLLQDIQRILLRSLVTKPLEGLVGAGLTALAGALGGGASAGYGASAGVAGITGAYADGGRPMVGRWSLVGERGPELFKPDVAGTIVPMDSLGMAGGGGPVFNVDMRGASVEAVQRLERLVARVDGSIESRAVGAVFEEQRRNGRRAVVR